jgi:uncharacterized protein (TIGR03437 family)
MRLFCWLFCAMAGLAAAQTINYGYDAAGRLTTVTYPNGKILSYTYDASGNVVQRTVADPGSTPAPSITADGVVNAASGLPGAVAAGERIVIRGTGLGPIAPVFNAANARGSLTTTAGQTTVLFDGVPAPVIYASASETGVVVPDSVAGKAATHIAVWHRGKASAAVELPVAATSPGLFPAAIRNADGSANGVGNAAAAGSLITLSGTGGGRMAQSVTVTIGGSPAEVVNAAAMSEVPGVFQIKVRIPAGLAAGPAPVTVTIAGLSSQPDVTVAVK